MSPEKSPSSMVSHFNVDGKKSEEISITVDAGEYPKNDNVAYN